MGIMDFLFEPDKSTQTSTTTSEPWAPQQPYIKEGWANARELWKRKGPDYFPGSTVAGFSPDQIASHDMIRGLAGPNNAGAQGIGQAIGANSDFMSGAYLQNPWNDAVFNDIQSRIMPAVGSSAMLAGRGGSGQAGSMATTALTNAYAPYAAQQYQTGLGRMQDAIRQAPGLNESQYFGADALNRTGQQQQNLAQSEVDDQVKRWNHYQNLDYSKLQDYMRNIGGNWGSSSMTETPVYGNSLFGNILGGASTIAGLGLFGG